MKESVLWICSHMHDRHAFQCSAQHHLAATSNRGHKLIWLSIYYIFLAPVNNDKRGLSAGSIARSFSRLHPEKGASGSTLTQVARIPNNLLSHSRRWYDYVCRVHACTRCSNANAWTHTRTHACFSNVCYRQSIISQHTDIQMYTQTHEQTYLVHRLRLWYWCIVVSRFMLNLPH